MAIHGGEAYQYNNALLARMSLELLRKLQLQPVEFELRKVLYEPNQTI